MHDERYPLEALFGKILSPFEQFLRRTTAGGIVLLATTIAALALATAIGAEAIHRVIEAPLSLQGGERFKLELKLHQWVNDGLMALFFLLVGLELKREILVGELSSLKDASLPVVAAVGGMVAPAAIYAALNAGTPAASGWGIPMATDIAFAVGILVLLAWRIPKNLIIFLTALAIADDLGAVLVIGLFYTSDLNLQALGSAALLFAIAVLFNRGGVRHPVPYVLIGVLLWLALHESGVHATLAGILLAITIPARPVYTPAQFERRVDELIDAFRADRRDEQTPEDPLRNRAMAAIAEAMERSATAVQSPLQRIEHRLTPWVTFGIIPLFALANAGIDLAAVSWGQALMQNATLGVVGGLVLGKFAGISIFSWAAIKLGIARLPSGVRWRHLLGAAWLAGIGFTMSLFIAELAFDARSLVEEAKLGILLGSALCAAVGLAWLYWAGPAPPQSADPGDYCGSVPGSAASATRTSSATLRTPSFSMMRVLWTSTVRGLMPSAAAISFACRPFAACSSTSRSRAVRTVSRAASAVRARRRSSSENARWTASRSCA
jgi:NhaA family Na+:H+ antiporter